MRAKTTLFAILPALTFLALGPSSGTLAVTSDPSGAAVYVDGALVGWTPVSVANLDAGEHRVRLVKDGYVENGRVITIDAGATRTLEVRLTPRAASDTTTAQPTGSGISSGPPPNRKKWIYLGAAGAGAAATAIVLATRNAAPTIAAVTASPPNGLLLATTVMFRVAVSDPDNDPLTYSWDLGEGATSTLASPSHVYASEGAFSPKVTVSDGRHTVTSSGSLAIKTLTGTWRGLIPGDPMSGTPAVTGIFVLTQSGTSVSGTYSDPFGPGTISGFVQTATPLVTMTILQTDARTGKNFSPFVFTGAPLGADVNTIDGVLNQSAFNNAPLTITRQ